MPNGLFQGLGNLAGGVGRGVGGIGEFLLHPLARGMSTTRQKQIDEAQKLIELAGGIGTQAGAKVAAEQLNKLAPKEGGWKASDIQGLSKTMPKGFVPTGATIGKEGGLTTRYGPGVSQDDRIKQWSGLGLDIGELQGQDPEMQKVLETRHGTLFDQIMEGAGKEKVVTPAKKAIPEIKGDWRKRIFGVPQILSGRETLQEGVPATEEQVTWQDFVTEPTAPSQATAELLKQQPTATRKAVSDASAVGLSQEVSAQITTSYGADALEALSGLNESDRTRVLALIQAYQGRGAIDEKVRTRIRKMLGLK